MIVIDPPWPLKHVTTKARKKQQGIPYKRMSIEEIRSLDIQGIATTETWLFLWTTQKYIFESKKIIEHWGFDYVLTMVWEKTFGISSGMPLHGFRWNAEFILVGFPKKSKLWKYWPHRPLIPAVFQAENVRHSQKPQRFYDLVAPLGENRIDLFARSKRDGWDVWGNEVESDIQLTPDKT